MKNRIVGCLVIGIAIMIGFIIYSFNQGMAEIVNTSCSHGPECAMWGTINFQTNISIVIMAFVVVIGLYLIFFGEEEKIVTQVKVVRQKIERPAKSDYSKVLKELKPDEKLVMEKIIDSQGTIFQSELTDALGFDKVKTSRILDKLEARGFISRRKSGMTNAVVLKI